MSIFDLIYHQNRMVFRVLFVHMRNWAKPARFVSVTNIAIRLLLLFFFFKLNDFIHRNASVEQFFFCALENPATEE